ncbi:MAG: Hsp20/alpha crystallin family protein [Burkholderiales bacterium]|nr:Hsp20/alpha crystallin family protein [Burkholderiales bacterium]
MASENEVAVRKAGEIQKAMPVRLMNPFEEMERIFESAFPVGWMRPFPRGWPGEMGFESTMMPRLDVIEKDEEIVVLAEVPGVDRKDLDISMTDSTLTIKGKTNHRQETEGAAYSCCEISHGAFSRTVNLPSEVNVDKAKAQFKDGMLEIDLPKMEKSRRRTLKLD